MDNPAHSLSLSFKKKKKIAYSRKSSLTTLRPFECPNILRLCISLTIAIITLLLFLCVYLPYIYILRYKLSFVCFCDGETLK